MPDLRIDQELPPVTLDDLLADGQPNAGPWVFVPRVQALKDEKDALGVFRVNADPIIAHGELPALPLPLHGDMDARRALAPVLQRITE